MSRIACLVLSAALVPLATLGAQQVDSSSDFAPTAQQRAVHTELRDELRAAQTEFDGLMISDLAAFNAMLVREGLQAVVVKRGGK